MIYDMLENPDTYKSTFPQDVSMTFRGETGQLFWEENRPLTVVKSYNTSPRQILFELPPNTGYIQGRMEKFNTEIKHLFREAFDRTDSIQILYFWLGIDYDPEILAQTLSALKYLRKVVILKIVDDSFFVEPRSYKLVDRYYNIDLDVEGITLPRGLFANHDLRVLESRISTENSIMTADLFEEQLNIFSYTDYASKIDPNLLERMDSLRYLDIVNVTPP